MRTIRSLLSLVLFVLVISYMFNSVAAETTTITGTIHSGVEAGCWLIRADGTGTDYLLIDAPDPLHVDGLHVQVTGEIKTDVASYCMQGEAALQVASYSIMDSQTTSLTASTLQYAATVPVGGFVEFRLATNPSTGTSWWIQSQPSGVEITASSGTDSSIDCAGKVGCSNLQTIYTVKGLVAGEYVIEFRNGHAWAKNEYYIVVLSHLTVLPQTQTQTTSTATVSTVTYTTAYTTTAYTTRQPHDFPLAPRSLAEVPVFLRQFWVWVACRFWGSCPAL